MLRQASRRSVLHFFVLVAAILLFAHLFFSLLILAHSVPPLVRLRPDLRTLEWRFARASPVAHCVRLDCVRTVTPLGVAATTPTAMQTTARPAAAVAPDASDAASVAASDTVSDTLSDASSTTLSPPGNDAKLCFSLVLDSNAGRSAESEEEEEEALAAEGGVTAAEEDGAPPQRDARAAASAATGVTTETLRRRARALLRAARAEKTRPTLHFTCGDAAQAQLWRTNLSLLAHTWQAASALIAPLALGSGLDATALHPLEPDAWCDAAQRAAAAAAPAEGSGAGASDWLATPTREERLDYAASPTAHTLATELILGPPFAASVLCGDGRADAE